MRVRSRPAACARYTSARKPPLSSHCISGEIGIRKPTLRMYELGAEQIGLAPPACVFVDDLPFNLEPAAELGMATVHHTSSEQTIPALERLLGIALR